MSVIAVTIDGFILTRGRANSNFSTDDGSFDAVKHFRAGGGLGAVAYEDSTLDLTVRNTVISRNRSRDAGGGVFVAAVDNSSVTAAFVGVSIVRNKGGAEIGGVYAAVYTFEPGESAAHLAFTLKNSVIARNKTRHHAGGIGTVNFGPPGSTYTLDVIASTITENQATGFNHPCPPSQCTPPGGGGINIGDGSPMTLNLVDTILYGNRVTGFGFGDDFYQYDQFSPGVQTTVNAGSSDLGEIVLNGAAFNDLGGNLSVEPGLTNSYRLEAASPLIDAGSCAGIPATDIDGDPRPSGAGCDIGADEFVP